MSRLTCNPSSVTYVLNSDTLISTNSLEAAGWPPPRVVFALDPYPSVGYPSVDLGGSGGCCSIERTTIRSRLVSTVGVTPTSSWSASQ